MFAVLKSGGKQYKVEQDKVIRIDKIHGEVGTKLDFEEILILGESPEVSFIGSPLVKGAKVTAEILSHAKNDKVIVFKKKRRQNYRRKIGHRQDFTELKILEIIKK